MKRRAASGPPRSRARSGSPRCPREMREPPPLDPGHRIGGVRERHALLINPFYAKDPFASFGKHVLTPSLALTAIAGATPEEWSVRYWDENLLNGPPPSDPFPEVVGITVHLTFARRAYELARWYRERGAKVVVGGQHVFACPEEAAQHADAIAIGEGVSVWPRILDDARRGSLEAVYRGDARGAPPRSIPRRELVDRRAFLTTASVIATEGCVNRCDFCYLSTRGARVPFRVRDPEEVAAEIRAEAQPYAVFVDNNLGANPHYLRRLCRALRPLEMIWSAAVTLEVTDDPSLVREMALAGCTGVFVGFESLSDINLRASRKDTPSPADFARRVRLIHDFGIQVNGSFVLGFDFDREDVFEATAQWVEDHRLECATFHVLTPYPGTPLFRRLELEGRLLHRDWSLYDTAHAVFQPRHMSPERLEAGRDWCYRRLFSHASIWRRRPAEWGAVMPYLAMSYLYKRSNGLWRWLIRHDATAAAWRPLVNATRRRHLRYRRRLAESPEGGGGATSVPAGV